jgi:hypothetical protein
MNPDIFILAVSNLLLLQIIVLFGKELKVNISRFKISVLNILVILYILIIFSFNYFLISGDKTYIEVPHAFGNVLILLTTIFITDKRFLSLNAVLLFLTIVSRLFYNACAITMAKDTKTQSFKIIAKIDYLIEKFTGISLNWGIIYYILFAINLYKIL